MRTCLTVHGHTMASCTSWCGVLLPVLCLFRLLGLGFTGLVYAEPRTWDDSLHLDHAGQSLS